MLNISLSVNFSHKIDAYFSNILILSPNGVFADYISHILPELGEENIREMSFDLFAYKELKNTAADCEEIGRASCRERV